MGGSVSWINGSYIARDAGGAAHGEVSALMPPQQVWVSRSTRPVCGKQGQDCTDPAGCSFGSSSKWEIASGAPMITQGIPGGTRHSIPAEDVAMPCAPLPSPLICLLEFDSKAARVSLLEATGA